MPETTQTLSRYDQEQLLVLLAERERREKYNFINQRFPDTGPFRRDLYPKSVAFMKAGATYRQRMFMAGNRTSKTTTAAFEIACHLTGIYPYWWEGYRFDHAPMGWVIGMTNDEVRDSVQRILLGDPNDIGSGLIPKDKLHEVRLRDRFANLIEVKHISGQVSSLTQKSYAQGRENLQAATLDFTWLDEEGPAEVYSELLTRLMTTEGLMLLTMTPLHGLTDLIAKFEDNMNMPPDDKRFDPSKYLVSCSQDEVPHLTDESRQIAIASYSPHELLARTKGIPALGSGAVYPIEAKDITIEPFEIPDHYRRVYGMDVGWNRTAAIFAAIDPDDDTIYIYSEHYQGQNLPIIHAQAIKARGEWIPGVIDPASIGSGQDDGQNLMTQYRKEGLRLTPANNAKEAGIYKTWSLLSTGKIKVFKTCQNFFFEYNKYFRDEKGKIKKKDDHLMDSLRYLVMSGIDLASAKAPPCLIKNRPFQSSNVPFI